MCGIAGIVGPNLPQEELRARLSQMCDAIWHRGPDEDGQFAVAGVALGMRRLSVIDPAGGSQPISNEDGSIQVVFNGEIYNHAELRGPLSRRHTLRSRADTEVIVHLYEEYGEHFVDHLRGMFAIALWDAAKQRLVLARDRLGIKPLYFWRNGTAVAFGSELRALTQLPGFPRNVDPSAVQSYLAFGYVPDSMCIFAGVEKLGPGHILVREGTGEIRIRRYWSALRPERRIAESDAIVELQRLLSDAVESHLVSDVPVGAFLSGGIDSSTVVAEMARLSPGRVRTFSIGFDDEAYNEAPHAAAVARELRTDHTELILHPSADALTTEVITSYDEPFGDSSALPMLVVSQLARDHVTVALSGDGGDELFGGYTRYGAADKGVPELPSAGRWLLHAAAARLPHRTRGRNYLLNLARGREGRYASTLIQPIASSEGGVVRDEDGTEALDLDCVFRSDFALAGDRDFLTQLTLVDIANYLPGDILTKVDRASMRVSLEARVPLLDHHLVEFAVSLPGSLKRRDGVGKYLLRRAIVGLVPSSVLEHPKRGFAVPLGRWFKGELRYHLDNLLRPGCPVHEFVDVGSVERIVNEHVNGRRDHSAMLWRLTVLKGWLENLRTGVYDRPHPKSRVILDAVTV
jgi:asparagine synthase (glutamine-hydrolysing)